MMPFQSPIYSSSGEDKDREVKILK